MVEMNLYPFLVLHKLERMRIVGKQSYFESVLVLKFIHYNLTASISDGIKP